MFVFCTITVWLALCPLLFCLLFDVLVRACGTGCEAQDRTASLHAQRACALRNDRPSFAPSACPHSLCPYPDPNGKWPQIPAFKFIESFVSLL